MAGVSSARDKLQASSQEVVTAKDSIVGVSRSTSVLKTTKNTSVSEVADELVISNLETAKRKTKKAECTSARMPGNLCRQENNYSRPTRHKPRIPSETHPRVAVIWPAANWSRRCGTGFQLWLSSTSRTEKENRGCIACFDSSQVTRRFHVIAGACIVKISDA